MGLNLVGIELLELTEDLARYKFFPEDSKDYGIVMLNRKSKERVFEKQVAGYGSTYAAHALRRIEEYQKQGDYLPKDMIAWY